MVDKNKDGEIDNTEMKAVIDAHKYVQYPTQEEIEAWVVEELDRDGNITMEEIMHAGNAWATSQGIEIPEQVWEVVQ